MKSLLRLAVALGVAGTIAVPTARAWDPVQTHIGMVDQAMESSAVHLRWMENSDLQFGLFSPLRLDPKRLTPAERRLLGNAARLAPAASGARPRGGPGACPGNDAPPSTRLHCVDGDQWEHTALGWIRFGVMAEVTPTERTLHHFTDPTDPGADRWFDGRINGGWVRRAMTRSNGSTTASLYTSRGPDGSRGLGGPTAGAWLDDASDPLAPASLRKYLEQASFAATRSEREHSMAMAMVCLGALLHVAQDQTVPAHVRADAAAFFARLSPTPRDRGLPSQERIRARHGFGPLPGTVSLAPRQAGAPAPVRPLREHLFGADGVAPFVASHFVSETTVPDPMVLDPGLSPERAAATLLQRTFLADAARDGASLTPWPAPRGYVRTREGRPLAAFETDEQGRVRTFLDEAVFRDQAAHLLPRAIELSVAMVEQLWPAWPAMDVAPDGTAATLSVPPDFENAQIAVVREADDGTRAVDKREPLRPGQDHRISGLPGFDATGQKGRVLLVLTGTRGDPFVLEAVLHPAEETAPTVDTPAPPGPAGAAVKPVERSPDGPDAPGDPAQAGKLRANPFQADPPTTDPPSDSPAGSEDPKDPPGPDTPPNPASKAPGPK